MKKIYREPSTKAIGMHPTNMLLTSPKAHDSEGGDIQYSRSFVGGDEE